MVRQYLQRHPYEMIVVDETVMVPFAFALETPRILNLHKIDYQHYWETGAARPWGGRKVLDLLESFKLWRFQRRILSEKYIECIVCSEDDARLVHKMNPLMRTAIVPNGVDCAMFGAPAAGEENTWRDAPTLIYMGTMYYYPNIDAVSYFWHEIYPAIRAQIPNVRLLIVGHQPPPQIVQLQNMPNVVVTGSVPDVRPYLSQSTALIVPLRLGGGTRLKILEAMASGLPVISTSIGAQGLDLEDGKDLLLADEPAEFAAKTVRLLNDPEWCRAFSARGRIVAQRYDWSVLFQRLIDGWTSPINITPSATGVR
jgi:glycosyltransferase involved in cell wall biosynthesis